MKKYKRYKVSIVINTNTKYRRKKSTDSNRELYKLRGITEYIQKYSKLTGSITRVFQSEMIFPVTDLGELYKMVVSKVLSSEMIFPLIERKFYIFSEYRTEMFKFTNTHRLVFTSFHNDDPYGSYR